MSDLIDRQAAIDDIWTVSPLAHLDREWIDRWLRQLPPANCSEFPNSSDTISRQQAIEALKQQAETMSEWHNRYAEQRKGVLTAVNIVEDLPPAQLGTNLAEVGTDCISREQAIEICDHAIDLLKGQFGAGALVAIKESIEQLPPAQPEIIRCKDCKHWIPYDWMFSEMWQSKNIADYPEDEIGCEWSDMAMKANDFCSRGERREVTE